jgi:hypothetical protein
MSFSSNPSLAFFSVLHTACRRDHERAMAAIQRKYWMFRPIIGLGRVLTAMGLMRDNTGSLEVTLAR